MSSLLAIGTSAVRAYSTALATVGENVSNESTAGYARRTVSFTEAPASRDGGGNLNGVLVQSITRSWDDYKATVKRGAAADAASAATYLDWMKKVESALSDDAAGIGQTATSVFTSADALAANPGDTSSRRAFLSAIGTTTEAFNTTAKALATASADIAVSATSTVEKINATLDSLDNVNASLHSVRAGTAAQANLLDQRDKLLDDLASSVGIEVTLGGDGAARVSISEGGVLLADTHRSGARLSLSLATGTNAGRLSITAIGTRSETPIANVSGALGGYVASADTIAQRRVALDTLAGSFATQINAWSAGGRDAAGAAGAALVSGTTAATLALATTDTAKVPAADATAANGNLLKLATLRGDAGVERQWSTIVTGQGRTVDGAKTASTAATARADSTAADLAEHTSVDLDTEAADLIRFQQAYSGAAKIIQAARETMQAILDII